MLDISSTPLYVIHIGNYVKLFHRNPITEVVMQYDEFNFELVRELSAEAVFRWIDAAVENELEPMNRPYITIPEFIDELRRLYGAEVGQRIAAQAFDFAREEGVFTRHGQRLLGGRNFVVFGIAGHHPISPHKAVADDISDYYKDFGAYTSDDAIVEQVISGGIESGKLRWNLMTIADMADWLGGIGVTTGTKKLARAMERCGYQRLGQMRRVGITHAPLVYALNADDLKGRPMGYVADLYESERSVV